MILVIMLWYKYINYLHSISPPRSAFSAWLCHVIVFYFKLCETGVGIIIIMLFGSSDINKQQTKWTTRNQTISSSSAVYNVVCPCVLLRLLLYTCTICVYILLKSVWNQKRLGCCSSITSTLTSFLPNPYRCRSIVRIINMIMGIGG